MRNQKPKQIKTKYNYNGQFIAIPQIVYDNPDLNATDKIVVSLIHSFKSTWNAIKTSTIAEYLNLERSTINTSIRKLVFLELLQEQYAVARHRVFRSLLPKTNDFKALITSDIFRNDKLTSTFKISLGVIIAFSLGEKNTIGGYNFNRMEALAEELNLSISSVYRHLKHLTNLDVIVPKEYARYTIKPIDTYISHTVKNNVSKLNHSRLVSTYDDDEYIDPSVEDALNRIYDRV